jgi:hypothetical protein
MEHSPSWEAKSLSQWIPHLLWNPNSCLPTYLTTWSRVLLWGANSHSVNEFPAFYGTRSFITVFTEARHWTLSWAWWIQFAPLIPISFQVPNLMSFFHCLGRAKESVQVRGALKHFATNYFFTVRLLTPRPTPKLEDYPLSAIRDCLFNIFAATLRI